MDLKTQVGKLMFLGLWVRIPLEMGTYALKSGQIEQQSKDNSFKLFDTTSFYIHSKIFLFLPGNVDRVGTSVHCPPQVERRPAISPHLAVKQKVCEAEFQGEQGFGKPC